jgi:hypothetical protein
MHLYITSRIFDRRIGISSIQNTFDKKKRDMKFGLQSNVIIIPN